VVAGNEAQMQADVALRPPARAAAAVAADHFRREWARFASASISSASCFIFLISSRDRSRESFDSSASCPAAARSSALRSRMMSRRGSASVKASSSTARFIFTLKYWAASVEGSEAARLLAKFNNRFARSLCEGLVTAQCVLPNLNRIEYRGNGASGGRKV